MPHLFLYNPVVFSHSYSIASFVSNGIAKYVGDKWDGRASTL